MADYNHDTAMAVLEAVSEGGSIPKACKKAGVQSRVVYAWISDGSPNGTGEFKVMYDIALKEREQHRLDFADELMEKARAAAEDSTGDKYVDDKGREHVDYENVQRARLKVDTYMKQAARYNPNKYGDRQTVQHAGHDGGPLAIPEGTTRETLIAEWKRLSEELRQSGVEPPPTVQATLQ